MSRAASLIVEGWAKAVRAHSRGRGANEPPAVALSFDDGPDEPLDGFLAALEAANARATFFVVGEQVRRNPAALSGMIAAGHEVGLHSDRHQSYLRMSSREASEDLRRCRTAVEEACGVSPILFRPPYGLIGPSNVREAARQGLTTVLWSRMGFDWQSDATASSVIRKVGWPEASDIVLLHDSDRYGTPGSPKITLAALGVILHRMEMAGLRVRPVGEVLEQPGGHPDNEYKARYL